MTMGIYKLVWTGSDKVYIGQSVDIENRFINHKSRVKTQNHSDYFENMWNKYGEPALHIIEECDEALLDEREIYWISVTNNINISVGGSNGLRGFNSPKCKSTKEQLIIAAELLTNENYTDNDVSILSGVSIGTIEGIRKGSRHNWLEKEFPETWLKLRAIKRYSTSQEKRFKTDCILMAENKVQYCVNNLSKFAKEHNLNKSHLCSLVRGEIPSHKGFVLIKNLKGGSDE